MSAHPHPDHCDASCPIADAIDRRTFVSRAALAAAAAALAACSIGDFPTSPASISGSVDVNSYPALANVGGLATLSLSGTPVAIVRTGTSSFVTLSRICPHQGRTINVSGTGFLCPGHKARYTADGTWAGGQRTSNMHAYPTVYDATTGTLTIG